PIRGHEPAPAGGSAPSPTTPAPARGFAPSPTTPGPAGGSGQPSPPDTLQGVIDLKSLREDPEVGRVSQRARAADPERGDEVPAADERHRALLTAFERQRAEQKAGSRSVGKASPEERPTVLAHAKRLAEQVKAAQAEAEEAKQELESLLQRLPNLVLEGVPSGGEDDYVVLRTEGTPRDFAAEGFAPADHLDLGQRLGAIDTERGVKVSGARFYFLTGVGARLELALLNAAVAKALEAGFTPMITPTMVKPEVMAGTGFLGEH